MLTNLQEYPLPQPMPVPVTSSMMALPMMALASELHRPARYPIVLAHGYMGFDKIGSKSLKREYFRGVRGRLEALGCEVHVARVAPTAGVAQRAAELARQIEALPVERVNIIAHSMGGLDARYAIAQLGLAGRVASLTTIGTPHRGTPLVDVLLEWPRLRRLLESVGGNLDGLLDLSPAKMQAFNQEVLDSPDVVYSSIVGAVTRGLSRIHGCLDAGYQYLLKTCGPNDGVVSIDSQKWGQVLRAVEADHLAQIGWSRHFDAQGLYATLAGDLAARGL